jgi:P27 family predicted phage terminase small subunit
MVVGRGRPRKPDHKRLREPPPSLGLVSVSGGTPEVPEPPSGLLKGQREAWLSFWSSPISSLVTEGDLPALERLFLLRDELARCLAGARRERLVEGSKGTFKANPLYLRVNQLGAAVMQLEDRFGLSPAARLRLGITLGDAKRSLTDVNADFEIDDDEETDLELFGDVIEADSE